MGAIFAALALAGSIGGSAAPRDSVSSILDSCPLSDLVVRAPFARLPASDSGFGCPIERTNV